MSTPATDKASSRHRRAGEHRARGLQRASNPGALTVIEPSLFQSQRGTRALTAESVTVTAVWLNEHGIDLTLMRYQVYRTGPRQIILDVSQLYPVREVADFEVGLHASLKSSSAAIDAPEIP